MIGMIIVGNNIDHNGQSYTVRVTKTGRLIAQHMTHLKTPIMTEKYLRQQIMEGTGCLKDIFRQTEFSIMVYSTHIQQAHK